MRKKIALVNQRYGLEVNGGSELLCRQLAEKLTDIYDVEVLTTCALDYTTWENYYSEGVETINGVTVRRFKTDRQRDMKKFNKLSEKVLTSEHSNEDEEKWLDEQGPFCTDCVSYVEKHCDDYIAIIFMTYLYYITAKCLPMKFKNAFLLPTAHDEPPVYLRCYDEVFGNAKALIYLTDEEKKFTDSRFNTADIPYIIGGAGVDVPPADLLINAAEKFGLDDYIIYIGRIDESKGCGTLFKYFREYKKRNKNNLKLALAGKSVMDIPHDPDIISLGFVSDIDKFSLIKDCRLLVLSSEFESLSMVVLESMSLRKPVLVNGRCEVLKGHCLKSDGGLYYTSYFEFEGALNYMLSHKEETKQMGENGHKYMNDNYRWDVIIDKIQNLIEMVTQ